MSGKAINMKTLAFVLAMALLSVVGVTKYVSSPPSAPGQRTTKDQTSSPGGVFENSCKGPTELVRVIVKDEASEEAGASEFLTYSFKLTNLQKSHVVGFLVGIGEGKEMRRIDPNIPQTIESPPGWQGNLVFDDNEYMHIYWKPQERQAAIAPNAHLHGFRLVLRWPENVEQVYGAAALFNVLAAPFQVFFEHGQCIWGYVLRASYAYGECEGPVDSVKVTVEQVQESPPTYLYSVTNLHSSPIMNFSLGIGDAFEMSPVPENQARTVESPPGWDGRQLHVQDTPYSRIFWSALDRNSYIAPGASLGGFRVVMPEGRGSDLRRIAGLPARPLDMKSASLLFGFESAKCAWTRAQVKPDK